MTFKWFVYSSFVVVASLLVSCCLSGAHDLFTPRSRLLGRVSLPNNCGNYPIHLWVEKKVEQ